MAPFQAADLRSAYVASGGEFDPKRLKIPFARCREPVPPQARCAGHSKRLWELYR